MTEELTGNWIECVVDNDYEIWNQYPFPIRRKGFDEVVSEYVHKGTGYIRCSLNNKKQYKHRIIGLQFIPNPNDLPCIDHINHERTDNRLENLRWVSVSENNRNRVSNNNTNYEFFDEIPCESTDDIIDVRDYGSHEFEDLYYCDDWFYQWNGKKYKRLHINYIKRGNYASVAVQDIQGKRCHILYAKFKRLYGID